jgi:hypothetical protein
MAKFLWLLHCSSAAFVEEGALIIVASRTVPVAVFIASAAASHRNEPPAQIVRLEQAAEMAHRRRGLGPAEIDRDETALRGHGVARQLFQPRISYFLKLARRRHARTTGDCRTAGDQVDTKQRDRRRRNLDQRCRSILRDPSQSGSAGLSHINLAGARDTREARDAPEIRGFRAAVLKVRIHLPPAESQERTGPHRRASALTTRQPRTFLMPATF